MSQDLHAALGVLACPTDHRPLQADGAQLKCGEDHAYPVADGVPVLVAPHAPETHSAIGEAVAAAGDESCLRAVAEDARKTDPRCFVREHLTGTCGNLYRSVNRLHRYPIPRFPLPEGGDGQPLIDIGAHWGRWSMSAARAGYRVVAVDPSLPAAIVGSRIAQELGLDVTFVVADGRHLPIGEQRFGAAFSYSVLQHFSKADAILMLREMARVCRPDSTVLVQMANLLGVRQLVNRVRQLVLRDNNPFRVRYWTVHEMRHVFEEVVGPSIVWADGYLSLNARREDWAVLPPTARAVVAVSDMLESVSERCGLGWLVHVADSIWIRSVTAG